jgi:glycosyltransferase involved in cell wall biosynthesis
MRILALTQIIPYPPDAGPRIKTWHVLRYLAERGDQVTLASFVRPDEMAFLPPVKEVCQAVHTVPIRRSRWNDLGYLLKSQALGKSFLMERDNLAGMRRLVGSLLAEHRFDVALADQLNMTQFLFGLPPDQRPRRIFDAHNAVWTIVERMKDRFPAALRPILELEMRRVRRYEGAVVRQFERTLAVTEIDRDYLADAAQRDAGRVTGRETDFAARISVIPIAVDTHRLQPVRRTPGSTNIMTLGTLHYPPNADGIRWFLNEVFPLITARRPDVSLTIVGKNPPRDFLQLAEAQPQQIRVTGYVPQLGPYMEKAALMVIPVLAGSGMRVRILEAFAAGMPTVTTTVGLEGIAAVHGRETMIADDPAGFAEAALCLLSEPNLAERLSTNSRRLAETSYDWRAVLKRLNEVLESK